MLQQVSRLVEDLHTLGALEGAVLAHHALVLVWVCQVGDIVAAGPTLVSSLPSYLRAERRIASVSTSGGAMPYATFTLFATGKSCILLIVFIFITKIHGSFVRETFRAQYDHKQTRPREKRPHDCRKSNRRASEDRKSVV